MFAISFFFTSSFQSRQIPAMRAATRAEEAERRPGVLRIPMRRKKECRSLARDEVAVHHPGQHLALLNRNELQ
jgi:hypothetical protein